MSNYLIQRVEYKQNQSPRINYIKTKNSHDLLYVNEIIKDFANSWKTQAKAIQHNAGNSVIFFENYRVEYTRLPSNQSEQLIKQHNL